MSSFRKILLGVLLTSQILGCAAREPSPETTGRRVRLELGDFIPRSGVADLRGTPALPFENPALWLPQPAVGLEGWGVPGQGWHPIGDRSALRFWRRAAGGSALVVDFNHLAPRSQRIEVALNGEVLGSLETDEGGRSQLRVPLRLGLFEEINEFQFAFDPPVAPGQALPPLTLLRVGVDDDSAPRGRASVASGMRSTPAGGLEIDRSGVFVLPLDIPADTLGIELRVRNQSAGVATHRLSIQGVDGQTSVLLSGQVSGQTWEVLGAHLERWKGESILLFWEVDLVGQQGRVELGEILLLPDAASLPAEVLASEEREATGRRPDVVVIVLDAARGDRFPGWDYPRQTMPRIEALADSSVSFRFAFSECPTTSCSIPAMITGVPFLPGGQVESGRQLAEDLTTLAEYLADQGYRTVGFSATPNNSASHNLDQGFAEFRELWGRDNPDHGPFNMSRLAVEAIAAQPADEPLFLQLHYLPPHQPYDPGPDFDRFTDLEYSGPIRPDMSLQPYSLGQQELEPRDLEHLIGLYDGNLSVADAAVGKVLDALRATSRFDDTLIVITSDHGEAFMEHGRQGHNTTLFDEMLHVPLMVRLPGGEVPADSRPDRLASTLDVVPTILGQLGLAPDPGVGGLDLFHAGPNPLRPRVLFFRTSHPKHAMLAARTSSWKAISWPRHQVQLLFQLGQDPAETRNLVGEQPLVYAGLGLQIRQHLRQSMNPLLEGDEVELTEEAEESLKSLGYLN